MASNGAVVREWARANGFTVPDRGRLPRDVHAAYQAACGMGDVEPPPSAAVCSDTRVSATEVRPGCGRIWTNDEECHCRRCHRHFSTVRNFDAHQAGHTGDCVDPELMFDTKMRPRFRKVGSPWGDIYIDAKTRPTDSATMAMF